MSLTPRLVLFGNSVFLAGIKAELKTSTHVELITVETDTPDVVNLIRRRNPTAVIFDLSIGYPSFVLSLLQDQPGLLLIGMMPSSDEMFLFLSQHAHAQKIQDFIQVINGLSNANSAREHRFDSIRLHEFISSATTVIPTRQQKLAVAVSLIGLCAILILVWAQSMGGSSTTAPLVGTAFSVGISPEIGLAFVVGLILGGAAVALWFRWERRS